MLASSRIGAPSPRNLAASSGGSTLRGVFRHITGQFLHHLLHNLQRHLDLRAASGLLERQVIDADKDGVDCHKLAMRADEGTLVSRRPIRRGTTFPSLRLFLVQLGSASCTMMKGLAMVSSSVLNKCRGRRRRPRHRTMCERLRAVSTATFRRQGS